VTAPARKLGPRLIRHSEPQITHDSYERISPGPYRAYCRAARIYWDPVFKKWLCVLRWDILNTAGLNKIAQIPQWLYIGRKPHATRRAQYWREWCRAHGDPPSRTDRMTARVFTRRIARVVVSDTGPPSQDGIPHYAYSVVRRIEQWETGHGELSTSVLQSHIPEGMIQMTEGQGV
jgi:hypothetical protein